MWQLEVYRAKQRYKKARDALDRVAYRTPEERAAAEQRLQEIHREYRALLAPLPKR